MRTIFTVGLMTVAVIVAPLGHASVFKIGPHTFDQRNAAQAVAIVEGPATLQNNSSPRFARYSQSYVASIDNPVNEFRGFARSRSLGRLWSQRSSSDLARHISFPEPADYLPLPNVHRCAIEITWKDYGVANNPGDDLLVFEVGSWEGFALAVRKVGSDKFSEYRYQFPNSFDATHNVNAVVFDFSKFGLAAGDVVAAVRIRSLFNSDARMGPDKVDHSSGEGFVIYPGDPNYEQAHVLRSKAGGVEFRTDQLGADLVYVVGLHTIQPLKGENLTGNQQAATK